MSFDRRFQVNLMGRNSSGFGDPLRTDDDGHLLSTPYVGGANVSNDNPLPTKNTQVNGVPIEYNKQSAIERKFNVSNSGVNYLRIRPDAINEHAESAREVQAVVNATTLVGQVFKASEDNINAMYLTLESAEASTIDGFESYANDAALQAAWIPSGSNNFLESTIVKSGSQSMGIPLDILNDSWALTVATTDYTGYTGSMWFYQDVAYGLTGAIVSVYIEDNVGNSKYANLVINQPNNWTKIDIEEVAMIEDQGTATDTTNIVKIGYRVSSKKLGGIAYIDDLVSTPPAGSVGVELWDMGATLPVGGVTSIDDGTQYTQIGDIASVTPVSTFSLSLEGGKRLYHLHEFSCGVAPEIPTNQLLTVGNYYAIVMKYVDTNVNVYGPNSSYNYDYYPNGYAFTAPDYATSITKIGTYNDLMFSIFSTVDTYVVESRAVADAEPASNANYMASVEDGNMSTVSVINSHGVYVPQIGIIDLSVKPIFVPKGGKMNIEYNADYNDNVTQIVFGARYLYEG